ncbi:MAG TPA: PRC-barrel domain-containing protein [Solirubrobacteraceae bacterium]|nr:PRC-barrel domain-containing protein [Solirubrobacteraceae bacterium]
MSADEHRGEPIAYMVLAEGTRVEGRDGEEIGTVKRVLADEGADIFDGLILDTSDGDRFVDAPQVRELYERLVILEMSAGDAQRLPEPTASPAAVDLNADDIAGDE